MSGRLEMPPSRASSRDTAGSREENTSLTQVRETVLAIAKVDQLATPISASKYVTANYIRIQQIVKRLFIPLTIHFSKQQGPKAGRRCLGTSGSAN